MLSPREVGALTARLEAAIEANLREDKNKIKRVAPNLFKVLFTYEETSRLNTQYIEALGNELRALIYEYVNNRRYEILGGVKVETGSDLFAKTRNKEDSRRRGFAEATLSARSQESRSETGWNAQPRTLLFFSKGGQEYGLI